MPADAGMTLFCVSMSSSHLTRWCECPKETLLDELREVIGDADSLALLECHAGTRLFIPSTDGQVIEGMTPEASALLADRYGGVTLRIPMARDWRFDIYRRQGLSNAKIARRLGITETGVEKIARRLRDPANQNNGHQPAKRRSC